MQLWENYEIMLFHMHYAPERLPGLFWFLV